MLDLYVFDRKLRLLVMEGMERIETAVRAQWANALAVRHGPHAYMNAELFACPWEHASNIAKIARELKASKEAFVIHYRDHYTTPFLPPAWAVVETFTFGQLSLWFKATKDTETKKQVAQSLGMPNIALLENVLEALSFVRNVCAHHGRLWNRQFLKRLKLIERLESPMIPDEKQKGVSSNRIYNYLLIMVHLMRRISPGTSWPIRLKTHIQTRSQHQLRAMGFPAEWQDEPMWQPVIANTLDSVAENRSPADSSP